MTGPVKLVCPTKNDNAFNKEWNAPTVPVNYFFVENADRTQGLKIVVSDGVVPLYSTGTTVTFSGVVATDATGQKVAQLIAFLSAVPGTGPAPIGKTSKGLAAANNGTLVKVWGKIVSKTINTLVPPETWTFGDPPQTCNLWDYEYITINDGGGDIKIPTHTQFNAMSNYDPLMSGLQVGDYVSVVGVQTTTNGSDVVVMPRNHFDILNFTDLP
jgi:hypothetical protein